MNKKLKIGLIIFAVLAVLSAINQLVIKLTGGDTSTVVEATPVPTPQPTVEPTPEPLKYEVVFSELNEKRTLNNVYVLINPGLSEGEIKQLAQDVKNKDCKAKDCNIAVHDDRRSLELDYDYTYKLTSSDQMTEWKKNHLAFVTEHLVATLMFYDEEAEMYPYKE